MESCDVNHENSASSPTNHRFTFKKRLCVFCAIALDLQDDHVYTNWDLNSLNEDTFIEGVSILCETLNIKDNLNGLFGNGGLDNWRLLGIDNFVQCICCEKCYHLVRELVSLQQLIVKSQISLKENARKLENFVVSSQAQSQNTDEFEAPSLEYSVYACVQLRQEILNNFTKKDESPPQPQAQPVLSRIPKSRACRKQPVVLLEKLEISHPPFKQDVQETCDNEEEFICPSPPLPEAEAREADEDFNEQGDEDDDDQEYQPIKRRRVSTGRKRGRPKKAKPPKPRGKPGRPRKIKQDPPPPSSPDPNKVVKRKRTKKPTFLLVQEEETRLEVADDDKKPPTIPSTKGGRPLLIGSRHYYFQHEGTGPKLHAIYFLTSSTSENNPSEVYLMIYNVKFQKTSTSLRCLHPNCSYQESLTGYFTDQTILRNMRFHIRFAHRSPPKKDKPEEDKLSFYYCYCCESQIDNKLSFLEHRRQMHSEDNQFPAFCYCEVCGDPSVPRGDLVQHVFSHKSELEKTTILKDSSKKGIGKEKDILKPMVHPCDQCNKYFKCHTELMTHRNSHVPLEMRNKFVCEVCGKGFQNAWVMDHHKRRVHLKDLPIVFECQVCGKGFMQCQKERWKEHLNMHTGEKPYQCEQCGKRFIGKWHLAKHVRLLHAGVKDSVTCEFCGKIYKLKKYLKRHCLKDHPDKIEIKRRDEDKNKYKPLEQRDDFIGPKLLFPCEPCGKIFIYKSVLITHLKNRHKMFYEKKEDYPSQLTLEDAFAMEANEHKLHQ